MQPFQQPEETSDHALGIADTRPVLPRTLSLAAGPYSETHQSVPYFLLKRASSRTKASNLRFAAASSRSVHINRHDAPLAHRKSARWARSPLSRKVFVISGMPLSRVMQFSACSQVHRRASNGRALECYRAQANGLGFKHSNNRESRYSFTRQTCPVLWQPYNPQPLSSHHRSGSWQPRPFATPSRVRPPARRCCRGRP
jgi:hypothetical protein